MLNNLQYKLEAYVQNPRSDIANYELGIEYHNIGQCAAALSYLLRAAELTSDNNLAYNALLINANNFRRQGKRSGSCKNQLLHAIGLCPDRPEAYFLLARYYQEYVLAKNEVHKYHESYSIAEMGVKLESSRGPNYLLDYPGEYACLYQKAVAAWWIGKRPESRDLFRYLLNTYEMAPEYTQSCRDNLKRLGGIVDPIFRVDKHLIWKRATYPWWPEETYSQAMQDLFVLMCLDGKKGGTYIEVGAGPAIHNNNTYLLESCYNWTGVSFDILDSSVHEFHEKRKNKCYKEDCTVVKIGEYVTDKLVDYLQIDCEPPETSLKALKNMLNSGIDFKVLTFEHDLYNDPSKGQVLKDSRKLLYKHGYLLVADLIGVDINSPFEDWWVSPKYIKPETLCKIVRVDGKVKTPPNYLLSL